MLIDCHQMMNSGTYPECFVKYFNTYNNWNIKIKNMLRNSNDTPPATWTLYNNSGLFRSTVIKRSSNNFEFNSLKLKCITNSESSQLGLVWCIQRHRAIRCKTGSLQLDKSFSTRGKFPSPRTCLLKWWRKLRREFSCLQTVSALRLVPSEGHLEKLKSTINCWEVLKLVVIKVRLFYHFIIILFKLNSLYMKYIALVLFYVH